VSSDLSVPWQGEIRWSLETLAGEMLQEGSEAVAVAPHSAAHVCTLDFAPQVNAENRRNLVFVAELWGDGACVARQAAFFAPTKHLRLANPAVAAQLRVDGPTLQIDLRAQSLARLVELSLAGEDVIFSDNYFDLPAGRTVSVTTTLPAGWNLAQARTALNVRSVYETYTQAPVPAAG
jgi:beta-mannosidase